MLCDCHIQEFMVKVFDSDEAHNNNNSGLANSTGERPQPHREHVWNTGIVFRLLSDVPDGYFYLSSSYRLQSELYGDHIYLNSKDLFIANIKNG